MQKNKFSPFSVFAWSAKLTFANLSKVFLIRSKSSSTCLSAFFKFSSWTLSKLWPQVWSNFQERLIIIKTAKTMSGFCIMLTSQRIKKEHPFRFSSIHFNWIYYECDKGGIAEKNTPRFVSLIRNVNVILKHFDKLGQILPNYKQAWLFSIYNLFLRTEKIQFLYKLVSLLEIFEERNNETLNEIWYN